MMDRAREGVEPSYQLFADGNSIFCEESQKQIMQLYWLLMWFEALFREKDQLRKK